MRGRYACGMEYRERIEALQKEKDELTVQLAHYASLADNAKDEPTRKSAAEKCRQIRRRIKAIEGELIRVQDESGSHIDPDTGLPR